MSREAEWWNDKFKSGDIGFEQLLSDQPGSPVKKFVGYLQAKEIPLQGRLLEVGCGMGRQCNWLAGQGFTVTGVDFSKAAIAEAKKRADLLMVKVNYQVKDIREPWKTPANYFDYILEINTAHLLAPKDLEHFHREVIRTLKPGGALLTYTLDRYSDLEAQKLLRDYPGSEEHTYIVPKKGLIERTFTLGELVGLYQPLRMEHSKLIRKSVNFEGQTYDRRFWWVLFRKS